MSTVARPEAQARGRKGIFATLYYNIYNFGFLSLYDLGILTLSCTFAWRCPTSTYLLPFFRKHMSRNHLDIGVGTGYFPSTVLSDLQQRLPGVGSSAFHPSQRDVVVVVVAVVGGEGGRGSTDDDGKTPPQQQQITLWDLSTTAKMRTKHRIHAVCPSAHVQLVEADCLTEPSDGQLAGNQKFDSISAFNLLHCIPLLAPEKATGLFATARRRLSSNGVFIGCTVLGEVRRTKTIPSSTSIDSVGVAPGASQDGGQGVGHGDGRADPKFNALGWLLMWAYNRVGIFTNWTDGPDDFTLALEREFESVETWIIGRMLVFRARKPRTGCKRLKGVL